jgi:hypothetical protein
MPETGLLAVDLTPASLSGAIRWYAEPRAGSALEIAADVVAKYSGLTKDAMRPVRMPAQALILFPVLQEP